MNHVLKSSAGTVKFVQKPALAGLVSQFKDHGFFVSSVAGENFNLF